ncbi:hypothetical protein K5I29_11355 [Flavobacterium agricola]|uniref:Phenylalanyl-tRNA synthetase subunit alpha n=1 Tax=Flavobacterium agricola TaxID=2870839 RepID=A0ABY6LY10_9FLAO|nr:hypothetical protein [Flavobacterium agricola]UYW01066.1 hypothetical protein K5I29_11355 [Flavobacterium agricola]
MKKDIIFPKVENVYVAAVKEWNDDFQENSWYAHLINDSDQTLEMVIVVSKAYGTLNGEMRKTGTFRHAFKEIAPKTAIKVELLENNVLQLNNEFMVSFFKDNQLLDKVFVFKTNTINDKATTDIPVMNVRGVLLK